MKRGTASNVNALPAAEEVNLGILEFSSATNKLLPVSKVAAFKLSKIVTVFVSTDLILFPLISTEDTDFLVIDRQGNGNNLIIHNFNQDELLLKY